jgi:hypothetical protein
MALKFYGSCTQICCAWQLLARNSLLIISSFFLLFLPFLGWHRKRQHWCSNGPIMFTSILTFPTMTCELDEACGPTAGGTCRLESSSSKVQEAWANHWNQEIKKFCPLHLPRRRSVTNCVQSANIQMLSNIWMGVTASPFKKMDENFIILHPKDQCLVKRSHPEHQIHRHM